MHVYSGATGEGLFTLASPAEERFGSFGWAIAGLDDLDGDGLAEVLVGAPGESRGSRPQNSGAVYLFSGSDGTLLRTMLSPNPRVQGAFGYALGAVSGADGGAADAFMVGTLAEIGPNHTSGRVYVHRSCPADLNADGVATSADFFLFLDRLFAEGEGGDFNRDGGINSDDFFAFLGAFFGGCG